MLREEMLSYINNWKENIVDYGGVLSTLIIKDDETGDKLYLFVGFYQADGLSNYSYSFMLLDKDDNPKTGYMTNRGEVKKYLPQNIKNNKLILPIIMDMTRQLMDKQLPDIIIRRTVEPLSGDSLKRYEEITNIMVNEYGYHLDSVEKNRSGETIWRLSKEESNKDNETMDETYEIIHSYTIHEIAQLAFGHLDLSRLKG
jgi:hypothetical protein